MMAHEQGQFVTLVKYLFALSLMVVTIWLGFYEVRLSYEKENIRNSYNTIFANSRRREKADDCFKKKWVDETTQMMENRVHRLPDVIGIGIQKCGTGAIHKFLEAHFQIRALKNEAQFFDSKLLQMGLNYYKKMLPTASDQELIFEKSPGYFRSKPPDLPKLMHEAMPNLKLLLIVCNPIDRALSDFAMLKDKGKVLDEDFDSYVTKGLSRTSHSSSSLPTKLDPNRIISEGVYHLHIERWLKEFNGSLLIIDGDEFLVDPGKWMEEIQRFLNIPVVLREKNFVKNSTTGMFCVRTCWINKRLHRRSQIKCPLPNKGRTRSTQRKSTYTMSNETRYALQKFYKIHNDRFFKLIGQKFFW